MVQEFGDQARFYVRWSRDMDADLRQKFSRDELSDVELPGLSANGLAVESWWGAGRCVSGSPASSTTTATCPRPRRRHQVVAGGWH
jgi:hypothetical protein